MYRRPIGLLKRQASGRPWSEEVTVYSRTGSRNLYGEWEDGAWTHRALRATVTPMKEAQDPGQPAVRTDEAREFWFDPGTVIRETGDDVRGDVLLYNGEYFFVTATTTWETGVLVMAKRQDPQPMPESFDG